MSYYLPVIIVIVANVTYDVCAKSIPHKLNHFAGLAVTYSCLAVFSVIVFAITSDGTSFITELRGVNWSVVTLGLACLGIETGYIYLFRAGWNLSLGGLVCNILLAVSMIFVGLLAFGDSLNPKQIIGVFLCIVGLLVINKSELTAKSHLTKSEHETLQ